ncbi:hypothetical protein BDK51DRAFT_29573 [Blyttiomyces helicus]|uniref:IGFBP N-terminal domain-containing protein n=1 Tax=Blyttiomyces helicus TaxID=388810 RepID=A0A4P9W881_9FUNG|nr:hypothetical protein BDK51DRAFT_29573 [Blyttiomyces helicus]|eukprot:RKO87000.1 hypothetical protein BDK51DRAFT_29573 [Blyttiomyces helicus]
MQIISALATVMLATAVLATPVAQFGGEFGIDPVIANIVAGKGEHCGGKAVPARVCEKSLRCDPSLKPDAFGICIDPNGAPIIFPAFPSSPDSPLPRPLQFHPQFGPGPVFFPVGKGGVCSGDGTLLRHFCKKGLFCKIDPLVTTATGICTARPTNRKNFT